MSDDHSLEERALELVKYDAACRAIAEARSVDEAKVIRDFALALQAYARQANNRELEENARCIRLRATRRIGELMEEQKKTIGFSVGTRGSHIKGARVDDKPTLKEAGIDKNLAHEARGLARLDRMPSKRWSPTPGMPANGQSGRSSEPGRSHNSESRMKMRSRMAA